MVRKKQTKDAVKPRRINLYLKNNHALALHHRLKKYINPSEFYCNQLIFHHGGLLTPDQKLVVAKEELKIFLLKKKSAIETIENGYQGEYNRLAKLVAEAKEYAERNKQ